MKSVVIIRADKERGLLSANVVDDFYDGNEYMYRDLYNTDVNDVVGVYFVERVSLCL